LIDLAAAREYIHTIATLVDLVLDPVDVEAATRDSDDDYLVALARDHAVDFIVSGDKDLLDWEAQTPPVVPPAGFERMLDSRDG
jgi:predicted nucleic acid-binding protein